MKKREATKAHNRALLIEAGRKVFATRGLHAARITDITAEAQLAAGTFYKYFADKGELFQEIVRELTPRFRERLRQSRRYDPAEPPEAWVRRGFAAFFDIVEEYPALVRLFLVQDAHPDPAFGRMCAEIRSAYEADLIADLRQWISQGAIAPIESEVVSRLIFSMAVTMALHFLSDPKNLRGPVLDALTHMVTGGVRALVAAVPKKGQAAAPAAK